MPAIGTNAPRRVLATALGALLYAYASLPTLPGSAVAWIALVPVLIALERANATLAFGAGWLFGVLTALALASVVVAVPGVQLQHLLVPAAILALYPALWAAGVVLVSRLLRTDLARDAYAVATWVLLDYLRANAGFLAFPIGTLAQSQVDNVPLLQVASVFGEHGVTALVVLGNVAVWRLVRRQPVSGVAVRILPIGVCVAAGMVSVARQSEHESTTAQPVVAALHTPFPSFGVAQVLEHQREREVLAELRRRSAAGARLLVTPETSFVNLGAKSGLLAALQALADEHDVTLVLGVAQAMKFDASPRVAAAFDSRIRAGLWIVRPHASAVDRYDKVRRVPFREYLPLDGRVAWPRWLVGTPLTVIAGPAPRTYRVPLSRGSSASIGPMVCWEGLFAAHARRLVADGAQVLVQVSNEGWFVNTSAGVRHNAAVRIRAVETGRWVVLASNAGPAEIIDAEGRVRARADAAHLEWAEHPVPLRSGSTLYVRVGDRWLLVVVLLCVGGLSRALISARGSGSSSAGTVRCTGGA